MLGALDELIPDLGLDGHVSRVSRPVARNQPNALGKVAFSEEPQCSPLPKRLRVIVGAGEWTGGAGLREKVY